MNILKPIAFTITLLTASFLTSLVPAQQKFVALSPVGSSVSPAVIELAAETFFSELSDEYFLHRYYSVVEENPAAAEKHNMFEFAVMDLNNDGRVELFVTNRKLSISANCATVVYKIEEDNSLVKLLETDGVFSVSAAAGAGGYKTIRTNRHESAAERSIAEFAFNAELDEYQQRARQTTYSSKQKR
jgi:hypothetical protein